MEENEKNLAQFDETCESCMWWAVMACDGKLTDSECHNDLRLSNNEEMAQKLEKQFQEDCQKACQPVYDHYIELFQKYCLDKDNFKLTPMLP